MRHKSNTNSVFIQIAPKLRQLKLKLRQTILSSTTDLINRIRAHKIGLTLAELLSQRPDIARRTAQRLIAKLVESGKLKALGQGRARRYFSADPPPDKVTSTTKADVFPSFIPLSADSQDILRYINQPLQARKPVGYQLEFLEAYRPNKTWYLSEPLRRQLTLMRQQAPTAAQF